MPLAGDLCVIARSQAMSACFLARNHSWKGQHLQCGMLHVQLFSGDLQQRICLSHDKLEQPRVLPADLEQARISFCWDPDQLGQHGDEASQLDEA